MGDTDFQDIGQSGSIFTLIMVSYGIISLLYSGITSLIVTSSSLGFGIAVFFIIMMLVSLFFTSKSIFTQEKDAATSASWFFGGLILIFITAVITKVVVLLNRQSLMSLLSSQLSPAEDFRLNTINVPIVEELFWLITIPMFTILLLNNLAKMKQLSWLDNKYVQLIIVCIVSGLSFALFHVGMIGTATVMTKATLVFLIGAFIFRTALLIFASDPGDAVVKTDAALSFAMGIHIGNNWAAVVIGTADIPGIGFWSSIQLLMQDFWGILFLIILVSFGAIALHKQFNIVRDRWF